MSFAVALMMGVPEYAFAWGNGPGSLSNPKLNLIEEKAFLDQFHVQKQQIISHPQWNEVKENYFILDLVDSKSSTGKEKPIRFVMIPQQKEFRYWNLYAQEKNNAEWEYKYKGSPLGYIDHTSEEKPKFVSYLTSSSIQSALDKLKIAYDVPSVKVDQVDPAYVRDQFPSAYAGMMCSDVLREKFPSVKDVYTPASYGTLSDDVQRVLRQDPNYANQKKYFGQSHPTSSVLGPSKNNGFHRAQVEFDRKVKETAFQTTLAGLVFFQHRFFSGMKQEQWMSTLLGHEELDSETVENPRYQRMVKDNLGKILSQAPPSMSTQEMLAAVSKINELHKNINSSCTQAYADYKKSDASTGTVLHGEKPYTASDRQVMQFNQDNRNARATLQKKYNELHKPQIYKLIQGNSLSLLFGSKEFRKRIGTYDAESCFKNGKSGLNENVALADVYIGRDEALKNLYAALNDRMQEYQDTDYTEKLKTYVVSYPMLVQSINQQLESKDFEQLRLSCLAISEVYQEEKIEELLDYGFMGVAVIAGALTAGMGTAAMLSVMGGITAVEATEAGLDWYGGYKLEKHASKGLLTGSNTVLGAMDVVDQSKAIQTKAKWDFGLTLTSYGLGDVAGKAWKARHVAGVQTTETKKISSLLSDTTKNAQDILSESQLYKSGDIPVQNVNVVKGDATRMGLDRTVDRGYQAIEIEGMVKGQAEKVGYITYDVFEGQLSIGWIAVTDGYRGQNVQDLLFREVLKSDPSIVKIATSLDQTNHEIFNAALRKNIHASDEFIQSGLGYTDFLRKVSADDAIAWKNYVKEAVKETPAHKTRAKFGFGEIQEVWPSKRITDSGDIIVQVIHTK